MLRNSKIINILIRVLLVIIALIVGKDLFKTQYFYLQIAMFHSPVYFVFVPIGLAYLYLIIGLARFKKWALFLFSSTFCLAIIISTLILLFKSVENNFVEIFISIIPISWLITIVLFLIKSIGVLILKKLKYK
ncbi:MAG: hypothetical protein PHO70_08330 [Candidatus Omnitrophica bacterium]|nr:hypothetical protein [Candidatus Omnitrophota bacterium]